MKQTKLVRGCLLYTEDGYWHHGDSWLVERSSVPKRVVKKHLSREMKYNSSLKKRGKDYHDKCWWDAVRNERIEKEKAFWEKRMQEEKASLKKEKEEQKG